MATIYSIPRFSTGDLGLGIGDLEQGRWGAGEMGSRGAGEQGRWGDGEMGRRGELPITHYQLPITNSQLPHPHQEKSLAQVRGYAIRS